MNPGQRLAPNVIIAGVPRCGTTSLFRYLAAHPDVCPSAIKEINFFTRERQAPDKPDVSAYARYFERCGDRPFAVFLEASPIYLSFAPSVAPAVKAALPGVRLVFVLRDPVARFVSHYRYLQLKPGSIPGHAGIDAFVRRLTGPDGRLSDERLRALEGTLQECVLTSLYAGNLRLYLDLFGADRVFIGYLEHLERFPSAFMNALCAFLGIRGEMYEDFPFAMENRRRNTRYPAVNHLAEGLTLRFEAVLNRFPALRERVRRVYFRLNPEVSESDAHGLSHDAEVVLGHYYAPSVTRLRSLMEQLYPDAQVPEWVTRWPAPK
jgi:hypothetical protein